MTQQQQELKKPCRVCSEFKTYRKHKAKEYIEEKDPSSTLPSSSSQMSSTNNIKHSDYPPTTTNTSTVKNSNDNDINKNTTLPYSPFPCPPDSEELGRSTWTFLHTMAAYYPSEPDIQTQKSMQTFFSGLSKFYPCGYCASHLQDYLKEHPPHVKSNILLSKWLCQVHNEVNERLGKPQFDCERVFERWRDGEKGSDC